MIQKQPDTKRPLTDPKCPRCGYDLRGIMETWKNACDLQGICSECGLEFEWGNVLDPRRELPLWNVEYAESLPDTFRCGLLTFFIMLMPWKFWRLLKMEHPLEWGRLAGYFFTLGVCSYLLASLAGGVCTAIAIQTASSAEGLGEFIQVVLAPYVPGTDFGDSLSTLLNEYFTSDYFFYGMLAILFLPAGFVMLPVSRRKAKVRWAHIFRITIYAAPCMVVPLLFLVLGSVVFSLENSFFGSMQSRLYVFRAAEVIMYATIPFLIIWWGFATGRYLKMAHPWGVALAIVILVTLAVTLTITLYTLFKQWLEMG